MTTRVAPAEPSVVDQLRAAIEAETRRRSGLGAASPTVVLAGSEDPHSLNVLVPSTVNMQRLSVVPEDALARYPELNTQEHEPVDLGDLGQWRRIEVTGVNPALSAVGSAMPLELVFLAAQQKGDPQLLAHAEMAWVAHHVLAGGQVVAVPDVGELAVPAEARAALSELLRMPIGASISRENLAAARTQLVRARELSLSPHPSLVGLFGTAGIFSPGPWVAKVAPQVSREGLSPETSSFLEAQQQRVPSSLKGAERCLQMALDQSAPRAVVAELRQLYSEFVRQTEETKAAEEAAFAESGAVAVAVETVAVPDLVGKEQRVLEQRLVNSTAGLGLSETLLGALAQRLAASKMLPKAQLVVLCGDENTAAARLGRLVAGVVDFASMHVDGSAIAQRGAPGLTGSFGGAYAGVGMLSASTLSEYRGGKIKLAVVTPNLRDAGALLPTEERDSAMAEYLGLLSRWTRDNTLSVKEGDTVARPSVLSDVLFVCHFPGSASELKAILDSHLRSDLSGLRDLKSRIIDVPRLGKDGLVRDIELRTADLLIQHDRPNVTVDLDPAVKEALGDAHHALDAFVRDSLASKLAEEAVIAATSLATHFRVTWALLPGEVNALLQGDMPDAPTWFRFFAESDGATAEVVSVDDTEQLRAQAAKARKLEEELAVLRGTLLKAART